MQGSGKRCPGLGTDDAFDLPGRLDEPKTQYRWWYLWYSNFVHPFRIGKEVVGVLTIVEKSTASR